DQAGELQDTWIEEEREYGDDEGNVLAHDVIRALLDDNGFDDLNLWLPNGPSPVAIRRYRQEQMPLLQAILDVAMQATWKVGFLWDDNTGQWRFAFYDPQREKTIPEHTFGPSQYLDVRDLSIDKAGIRNVVEVV